MKTSSILSAVIFLSFSLYHPFVVSFDELDELDQLAPMQKPNYQAGFKRTLKENGKSQVTDEVLKTIQVEGIPSYHWQDTAGCQWNKGTDLFSPGTWWGSCKGWAEGTQTYKSKGEAWPLKVGHKWKYGEVKGSDDGGKSWKTTRKCGVKEAVRFKTSLGEFDTFKVNCEDSWKRLTWYVSPELNAVIYFVRQKKKSRRTFTRELVKLEGE